MNNCYSCTTCKSADKPLEGYIAELPMETGVSQNHQNR